jgi:hypothetical protein
MWEDPIVKEVREIRKKLSASFNFDVHAIFEDLRKKQTLINSKLIRHKSCKTAEQAASPDRESAALHPGSSIRARVSGSNLTKLNA